MNSSRHKILFRCDAADIPEIGTGHLYRCLTIANLIKKKFKTKNKDISFLVKTKNKYNKSISILKKYRFTVVKIENSNIKPYSYQELLFLKKNPSNLLIIDRLGKINKTFSKKIEKYFSKKIIFDDSSINRKFFDLSINPLIHNVKKVQNSHIGFNYLVLPSIFKSKYYNLKTIKKNNIFIYFGGYDHKNLITKIIKLLNKIDIRLNIFVYYLFKNKTKKIISNNNLIFFKNNEYFKRLGQANIAITAGGLGLFDSIIFKKKVICIPQYEHQELNAKKLANKGVINLLKIEEKNFKAKFKKTFMRIYDNEIYKKKITAIQHKIININKLKKTMTLIYNLYEKSES